MPPKPLAPLLKRLLPLAALIIVLFGAWWRWHYIDQRPLHADEAVQAWQTWQLLRGEGYRYDPVDRHGPWLYYGAAAWEKLRGGDAASFNDKRARSFVWLAGGATLVLVALAASHFLGGATALGATALLAVTPLAVLYQTYFVQEAWLALFTWSALFLALFWLERPRWPVAVTIGVVLGLMQATKETSVLHFAALGAGLIAAGALRRPSLPRRAIMSHLAFAAGAALLVYVLLYSGFGAHWSGVIDGVRTYWHQWERAGETAHTKPFSFYAQLLLPQRQGGVTWGEPALLAFALGGAALAFRRASPPAARAVAATSGVLFFLYSFIPYKTPWLLLTPLVGFTLLAGFGLAGLTRVRRWGPILAAICAVVAVAQSAGRTRLALDRYPGDERNPYFYQQTPRGFTRLVERLHELRAATPTEPLIAVVSPDYAWPLPWYLRDFSRTGYFASAPAGSDTFDVLIWDSQLPPPENWPEESIVELHGVRPNVLLYAVISRPLWQAWEAAR